MLSPHSHVAGAEWWLHSIEGACALWFACVSTILCVTSLILVDSEYATPGLRNGQVHATLTNPLNVGQQAEVIAENLLTRVGSENLVADVVRVISPEGWPPELKDQRIAMEVGDGHRMVWLTVDKGFQRGGNGNCCT